jgi:hypothetical protein
VTAEIVDSVVASVGYVAIKHSDVLREIRMAAFMNHEDPNFSAAAQKDAVSRLVDQAVIREEIESGMYVPEDPQTADSMLQQLRSSYGGPEAFAKALSKYGITEEQLKKQLQWQASVLRFIQLRFGGGESAPPSQAVNDEFFAWLDQMRDRHDVQIKEARLQ